MQREHAQTARRHSGWLRDLAGEAQAVVDSYIEDLADRLLDPADPDRARAH